MQLLRRQRRGNDDLPIVDELQSQVIQNTITSILGDQVANYLRGRANFFSH